MYILVYMYTYSRVTSICIDLSKIKLFVIRYSLFVINKCNSIVNILEKRCIKFLWNLLNSENVLNTISLREV